MNNSTPLSSIFRDWLLQGVYNRLSHQDKILELIMTTVTELGPALTSISDQLTKATEEIVNALANTVLTPEAEAALVTLKTVAKVLDDLNPDNPLV